jgi:hypothetical protein
LNRQEIRNGAGAASPLLGDDAPEKFPLAEGDLEPAFGGWRAAIGRVVTEIVEVADKRRATA